jgi:uncharacterized repeat protein (TIGR04076 family)
MYPQPKTLVIEVVKKNGICPTYQIGDQFKIDEGYKLVSNQPVCLHALQGLTPYYIPLSRGMSPYDLGLSAKDANHSSKEAYFQCHDPEQITGGGSVIFKIRIED